MAGENVGDLQAQLSLFYQQFDKALKDVEKKTAKVGKTIEKNLTTSAKTDAKIKDTGNKLENNLGKRPKDAINQTERAFRDLVWTSESGVKSIARVVTGILISQTFYKLIQAIQRTTGEIWKFSVEMEQAYLALELMLGGLDRARFMLKELETFAAWTPFQMGDVIDSTRTLLGFGYAANEVLPILNSIADASAIIGVDPQRMKDLIRVMGKIRATGRMEARDIRSFGAAGIPIFQILQEEIGLTREEIRNIGREARGQAEVVIPAIIRGLEKRFGGAAEALSNTLAGAMSTIKDNLLLISKDVFSGLYEVVKRYTIAVRDRMNDMREALVKGGIGGLFEHVFPKTHYVFGELVPGTFHNDVKQIIVSFMVLAQAIMEVHRALQPLRSLMLEVFIKMTATVVPIITLLATAFARLVKWIFTANTWVSRFASSLIVGAMVAKLIVTVVGLSKALAKLAAIIGITTAVTTKWGVAILFVVSALSFLLLAIPKVRGALGKLMNNFMSFLGIDMTEILKPIDYDSWIPPEATSDSLNTIKDGFSDIGSEAEKTKKVLDRFLMSFDEVYTIPEEKDLSAGLGDIGDMFDDMDPEMIWPDFGEMETPVAKAMDDLLGMVWSKIKDFFTRWGPWIMETFRNLWTLRGDIFGYLWTAIKDVFKAFGQFFKDIGNAIKQFAIDTWNSFVQLFKDIYSAIGKFIIDIKNAIVEFASGLWQAIKDLFIGLGKSIWQFVTEIWTAIKNFFVGIWDAIKQLFSDLVSAESFADVIAAFGTFFGTIWNLVSQFGSDIVTAFSNLWNNVKLTFTTFFGTVKELAVNFKDNVLSAFNNLIANIRLAFGNFRTNMTLAVNNFKTNITKAFTDLWANIKKAFTTFIDNTIKAFKDFLTEHVTNTQKAFPDMMAYLETSIGPRIANMFRAVSTAITTVLNNVKNAAKGIIDYIIGLINNVISLINRIPGVNIRTVEQPVTTKGYLPPGMASGGVLKKEQLVRAAEAGRPEAYTPLTAEALKPWAEAIAGSLQDFEGGGRTGSRTPVYVGTLIADERSLRELERRMEIIRVGDSMRKGE